jgi:hypothetical protein
MKIIRFQRNFLFVIPLSFLTMVLFWGTTFSFKARADASCNALLSDLSQYLQGYPSSVSVLHMTNYQANKQWWGGYTQEILSRSANGHLEGSGSRLISTRTIEVGNPSPGGFGGPTQPFSIKEPDPMSYDIDPQSGKITFQGRYGPYDMTCLGNKFAIVNTWDSLETFTFDKFLRPR